MGVFVFQRRQIGVEVNLIMADIRATVRRTLSSGHAVMCHVHVTPEPWNAALTQQEINAQIVPNGIPSPQTWKRPFSRRGNQCTFCLLILSPG